MTPRHPAEHDVASAEHEDRKLRDEYPPPALRGTSAAQHSQLRAVPASPATIRSVLDVPRSNLLDFYRETDPDRSCPLSENWEWLYRPRFFEGKTCLVMEQDNRVIAHAGMIPFWLSLRGQKVSASWYVDFAVRPEFQRAGFGRSLTLEWMKPADVHVSFCNERSMGLFRKLGWVESFNTRLHHFFLMPLRHPAMLKRLDRRIPDAIAAAVDAAARGVFRAWYGLQSRGAASLEFAPASETLLAHFESTPQSGIAPIRDAEYLRWRFLESPHRQAYRVVLSDGRPLGVVKERMDKPRSTHVDLLLVKEGIAPRTLVTLIARLGVWAARRDHAYLRYYESDPERSRRLQRALLSYVLHPRFAFFTKRPELMRELEQGGFSWQLADSDFEVTA